MSSYALAMKRKRRMLLSFGVAFAVLAIGLLVLAGFSVHTMYRATAPCGVLTTIWGGRIFLLHDLHTFKEWAFGCYEFESPLKWYFSYDSGSRWRRVAVPLWAPILVSLASSIWMLNRYRRSRLTTPAETCSKCGYTRAGLSASALCPECSTAPIQG